MPLLKNGSIVNDPFIDVSGEDTLPASGSLLVSIEQWRVHKDELAARPDACGVVLRSDEKPENIADSLDQLAVIALDFPAFGDGRAYSYARLLRDQYGYEGELRAVGDVLLEQLHFMHRVGFNAFQIKSDHAIKDWEIAAADVSVWYQPTCDGRTTVLQKRHK
jgi:uncharacterized protein (DUF934 family)